MSKGSFIKKKEKKKGTGLCALVLVLSGLSATEASADLNDEIRRQFMQMHTVTVPDSYKTQRRGVISGGSVNIRNGIENTSVLSFSAPKLKSGCRGIDLYGGSFSYINKEEFIRFLRAIAANAEGYAFEVALSSMCEKCAQHIETLQRKVQSLNQYFGNSCQLAEGIVNDSLAAVGRKGLNDATLLGQAEGLGDLFELNTATDTAAVYGKLGELSGKETEVSGLTGNIMWNLLIKDPVMNRDRKLAEAVMSLTGTVIVSSDGSDVRLVSGMKITLKDLVAGGEVYPYVCEDRAGGCLNLITEHAVIRGFGTLIRRYFMGNGTDRGIIYRYARNEGAFSEEESSFLNTLPEGVGSMIRNLASRNENAAEMFVEKTSGIMALLYARNLTSRYLSEASSRVRMSGSAYSGLLESQINEVREELERESSELNGVFGEFSDLGRIYLDYMELLPEKDYVPEGMLTADE